VETRRPLNVTRKTRTALEKVIKGGGGEVVGGGGEDKDGRWVMDQESSSKKSPGLSERVFAQGTSSKEGSNLDIAETGAAHQGGAVKGSN